MQPTVLVACDSATADRSPIGFASALARLLGARLQVVSVRPPDAADEPLAGGEASEPGGSLADLEARLRRDPSAELRVLRAGSPAAGLQRLIAAERPALAVLGSAHGSAYGRVRLGGTAERVLLGASQPVVVVPRGRGDAVLGSIAVGLLPTADGLRALGAAAALARAARVPLQVLLVLRRSPDRAGAVALAARLAPGFDVPPGATAAEILDGAIHAAAEADAPGELETAHTGALVVDPQVLVGDPPDALLRASARAGLLVLGSRGYGPAGIVLPGGAARRLLDGARCPVLLLPRAEAVREPGPVPVAVAG